MWFGHVEPNWPHPPSGHRVQLKPLVVAPEVRRAAIDGYCNRTLWPALHGMRDRVEHNDEWARQYQKLGRANAEVLADELPADATVWVHDYHHFALPGPLRALRPDLRIGLFVHTPVDESFRGPDSLIASLAACDHIATQTSADADALSALLVDASAEPPIVEACPVGFDVDAWRSYRCDSEVGRAAAELRRTEGVLAVGVDRMDYTKAIPTRLEAISFLLETGQLDPSALRLIQVATPSRSSIPAYAELDREVRARVLEINSTYPRPDGRPVVELRTHRHSPRELAVLMRAADVAIVNPIRDGMNLVAAEYSIVNGDRPCSLILSRGAGVAEIIGPWSTLIDGGDHLDLAASLLRLARCRETDRWSKERDSQSRAEAASLLGADRWVADCLGPLDHASFDLRV